jgi:ceramide glucosyltransferase
LDGADAFAEARVNALRLIASVWAAVAALFSCITLLRLARRRRATMRGQTMLLVVRPADALRDEEREALREPLTSERIRAQLIVSPEVESSSLRWVKSDPSVLNRKIGHVQEALREVPMADSHLVVIDSDVAATNELINALGDALDAGADIAMAAPRIVRPNSFAEHALAGLINASQHEFSALFCMSAGAKTLCGKALAMRRDVLDVLPVLASVVGEDLELAKIAHRRRMKVALVAPEARVLTSGRTTWDQVGSRMTRWMCVLRAHRPLLLPSVPLLFCPTLLLLPFADPGVLCAYLCIRTALGFALDGWRGALRWPLGETLLFASFVRSLSTRRIEWRGRRYTLSRGGHMQEVRA